MPSKGKFRAMWAALLPFGLPLNPVPSDAVAVDGGIETALVVGAVLAVVGTVAIAVKAWTLRAPVRLRRRRVVSSRMEGTPGSRFWSAA
jgi:hypothetical protein